MAYLSIREAVKHFDVSRPTLANALKTGKVTGVKDGQGVWSIDPAELARIYSARSASASASVDKTDKHVRTIESELSVLDSPLAGQFEALRESLVEAERRAAESEQLAIENAQRAAVAEALAEERKRILDETLKLIPPPAPKPVPIRRRWWPF